MCSISPNTNSTVRCRNLFIKLAKESPIHSNECSESDEDDPAYDSVHGKETDICRDTSDTESGSESNSDSSYTTEGEGIATVEVVEYEVASCSSVSGDMFFTDDDSTSGTDEMILATLSRSILNESTELTLCSDSESDSGSAASDPELKKADYWQCVKCKNKQNNPMYRYCEKCYQLRKTHFPPRPTFRKSRTSPSSANGNVQNRFKRKRRHSSTSLSSTIKPQTPKLLRSSSEVLETQSLGSDAIPSPTTPSDYNIRHQKSPRIWSNSAPNPRGLSCRKRRARFQSDADSDTSEATQDSDGGNNFSRLNSSRRLHKNISKRKRTLSRLEEMAEDLSPSCPLRSNGSCKINSNKLDSNCISVNNTPSSSRKRIHRSRDESITKAESRSEHSQPECVVEEEEDCSKRRRIAESTHLLGLRAMGSTSSKDSGFSSCNSQEYNIRTKDSDYSLDTAVSAVLMKSNSITSQESAPSIMSQGSFTSSLSDGDDNKVVAHDVQNGHKNSRNNSQDISLGMCIMCLSAPKDGVFVHSRFLHLCCCYRCAKKCWKQRKQCPICNCKVNNVLKLYVH